MELHEALQMVKYDTRLIDWNLKQGLINKDDYDMHLKALPDSTDRSQTLDLEVEYSNGSLSEAQ
jgi:hypothetical protein